MNTNRTIRNSILTVGLAALLSACPSSSPQSGVLPVSGSTGDGSTGDNANQGQGTATAAGHAVFPEEAFRNGQPKPTAARPFNLPGINQFKLGGIDVFLVERHDLPTISVELNFDGGTANDRIGREGTAGVCMSMVSEGTKKLDKLAFEEALADMASGISSYAGSESQGVSMYTLSKNFDATLALYIDTLVEPGFRDSELSRMVKRRLESLKQAKGSPGSVAGRLVRNIVYGPKHAFGKITSEKSLGKIKLNDCKAHHKAYVKPNGARLFVVGDMTQAQLTAKFAPLLAKWKGSPKKVTKVGKPQSRKGRVFFVDIPGAAQSSIYIAHKGPGRQDPGYYANQMMSGVLGGGFSSRINMNLREDKGYSYGARGSFSYNRHFGTFMASSSVRSDSTRQSLDELFMEISDLQKGKKPARAEELQREKNGSILGLPARFATASQVLSVYRGLQYYGLPMTYYVEYGKYIDAVTLEQVNAAAAKLLHSEDAIVVVVGDGSKKQIRRDDKKDVATDATLLDSLKALAASEMGGKGKLVILNVDGNPIRK
ncbi:MAG: insulinase family protein [Kofleriaceae bacterium]|nr:insulinase family protein [Kofleriaceae bacterium]